MNFKKHLDFIRKDENFYLGKALIADELDCQKNIDLDEETFELICAYAYDYYLNSKASANEIIMGILETSKNHQDNINYFFNNLNEFHNEIEDTICCMS